MENGEENWVCLTFIHYVLVIVEEGVAVLDPSLKEKIVTPLYK